MGNGKFEEMLTRQLHRDSPGRGHGQPGAVPRWQSGKGNQGRPGPKDIKAALDRRVIGQEEAKVTLATAVYGHYARVRAREATGGRTALKKSNILLFGPTGSGKTLLAQTLAETLNVPFAMGDATQISENGYWGDDAVSFLTALYNAAGQDAQKASRGIIYIDEFDKIASDAGNPYRGSNNRGTQQGLLKILEGSVMSVPVKGRKMSGEESECVDIDTTDILFICGGAFVGLDKIIERRVSGGGSIGFTSALKADEASLDGGNALVRCEPKDLEQFGLMPEIVGRLPLRVALSGLGLGDLVRVLKEPRGSLVEEFKERLWADRKKLEFTEGALVAMARLALDEGTGARGLRSIMEKTLRTVLYEAPTMKNLQGCVIGEGAVTGQGKPRFVFRPRRGAGKGSF